MQIKLELSITEIEMANLILQQGVKDAKASKFFKDFFQVTPEAIEQAEKFRLKLIDAFLNKADKIDQDEMIMP